MLSGIPTNSDITIMNTIRHYPTKNEDNKWTKGAVTVVAKDNNSGIKFHKVIEDPKYEFFIAKPNVLIEHPLFFIDKKDVDPVEVSYVELEKEIAKLTGNEDFYYENIKLGNRYNNSALHMLPNIFRSDMNLEDYIRFKFSKNYTNSISPITKSYIDIEVDVKDCMGDFPEPGECPINLVNIIIDDDVYSFILDDNSNPAVKNFREKIEQGNGREYFLSKIWKQLTRSVCWKYDSQEKQIKKLIKLGLDKLNFNFIFYNTEIDLLTDLFRLINTKQPDFVLAWNMSFDIPYIMERIRVLGYDPAEIMCHPDFKYKECSYFIDKRVENIYAERCDYAKISSYTVYLDQMLQFASRRKGQAMPDGFSLDSIGNMVCGARKLSWHHITRDFAKFAYLDFELFLIYGIIDTVVQKAVENTVEDLDYVFSKVIGNHTRYHKIHRQTVYLTNQAIDFFDQQGFIMGNNSNRGNEKPTVKFAGAFVASPEKISNYARLKVNGQPVNIFDNANDFDYARLYPSEDQESNMAPNTQIGKIYIPEQIHNLENRSKDEKYDRGGAFLENLASRNYLEFSARWLKFGSFEELYDDLEEFYTKVKDPGPRYIPITADGLIRPIRKAVIPADGVFTEKPMLKLREGEYIRPMINISPMDKELVKELLNGHNRFKC